MFFFVLTFVAVHKKTDTQGKGMQATKQQQDQFSSKDLKAESDESSTPTGKKPMTFERVHSFLLWLSLSLGFAVSYMQRLSPSTWGDNIAEEFETDAAGFGSVAASYWYFYATLQIPIGIILDLYGRFVIDWLKGRFLIYHL